MVWTLLQNYGPKIQPYCGVFAQLVFLPECILLKLQNTRTHLLSQWPFKPRRDHVTDVVSSLFTVDLYSSVQCSLQHKAKWHMINSQKLLMAVVVMRLFRIAPCMYTDCGTYLKNVFRFYYVYNCRLIMYIILANHTTRSRIGYCHGNIVCLTSCAKCAFSLNDTSYSKCLSKLIGSALGTTFTRICCFEPYMLVLSGEWIRNILWTSKSREFTRL